MGVRYEEWVSINSLPIPVGGGEVSYHTILVGMNFHDNDEAMENTLLSSCWIYFSHVLPQKLIFWIKAIMQYLPCQWPPFHCRLLTTWQLVGCRMSHLARGGYGHTGTRYRIRQGYVTKPKFTYYLLPWLPYRTRNTFTVTLSRRPL